MFQNFECGCPKVKDLDVDLKKNYVKKMRKMKKRDHYFIDNVNIPTVFIKFKDNFNNEDIIDESTGDLKITNEDFVNITQQLDICNKLGFSCPNLSKKNYGMTMDETYGPNGGKNIEEEGDNIYNDILANYNYQFLLPYKNYKTREILDYSEIIGNTDPNKISDSPIRILDFNRYRKIESKKRKDVFNIIEDIMDNNYPLDRFLYVVIVPQNAELAKEIGVRGYNYTTTNAVFVKEEWIGFNDQFSKKLTDRYSDLKDSASLGKVLIHEIGHLLDLPHTFDEGLDPFGIFKIIKDTPCTRKHFYLRMREDNDLDPDESTIAKRPEDCRDNRVVQIENFMDYSKEQHFDVFTRGQKIISDELFYNGGRLYNMFQESLIQFYNNVDSTKKSVIYF